jgi:hypothetical protein
VGSRAAGDGGPKPPSAENSDSKKEDKPADAASSAKASTEALTLKLAGITKLLEVLLPDDPDRSGCEQSKLSVELQLANARQVVKSAQPVSSRRVAVEGQIRTVRKKLEANEATAAKLQAELS